MTSLLGRLARREQLRGAHRSSANGMGAGASREGQRWVEPFGERLDFDSELTPRGPRHVRTECRGSDARIGVASLGDALAFDSGWLARLALEPGVDGLGLEGALYLDTETSGLGSGTGNRAFLVGMSWFDRERDAFVLEQLLLRDPDDEPALLERVGERVAACAFLVTYNGKSFDVPLLRTRASLARLEAWPERPHVDLLHLARRIHARRGWRMGLGAVEKRVLRFERGPDIGGEEVAARYAHYLFSGDEGALADVVTHNRHDVWSLIALLGHYGRATTEAPVGIEAPELSAMARVLRRAGDLERASSLADRAVVEAGREGSGDSADALRTRAGIARSRGDKSAAITDLERLLEDEDDPDARLELAKLYEHFVRDPSRALGLVELGTGESASDRARRRERLLRKRDRMRR